ncbi:MAG: helix-turn-helix domain-containing protein [Methanolinea sp.]|jgi:transposase-like protein|nr:helix-turn-helix domain-containing protein [Methanolinea sp.]
MSHNKTSKRSLVSEEKRQRALDLRRAGVPYRDIAREIGVSPGQAYKYVVSGLRQIRERNAELAEDVRTLERLRLDNLFQHAFNAVLQGDLSAIDRCIKVMDRRARMDGLDAPSRSEVTASLTSTPEWIELRTKILNVLEKFPGAKEQLIRELQEV